MENGSDQAMTIDHAGVSVSDLGRSHAFYRDMFGFTETETNFVIRGKKYPLADIS